VRGSQIFILDDDPKFRGRVREGLGGLFGIVEAGGEAEFRTLWAPRRYDLLLLDMRLRRDREGMDVLREVFAQDELQPVIMVSAYGDTESAIEAVGAGAMMFLHKREFTPSLLGRMAEAVIAQGRLRRQVQGLLRRAWAGEPEALLGDSPGIREAAAALREVGGEDGGFPLVLGERGCGMSLVARLIHRRGRRSDGPFLEVAAALAERKESFFEGRLSPWAQAAGGTLAVDGVEQVPARTGAEIAEAAHTGRGEFGTPDVVFLLHENADSGLEAGISRKIPDWLSGEAVLPVYLPPLRERREDVPLLAAHFLQRQRTGGHTTARSIGSPAMARLEGFSWPGNVRELRNAVEYAALQAAATDADEVGLAHLPPGVAMLGGAERKSGNAAGMGWDYRLHLARTELELADRAIRERGIAQKTALGRALGYTDRFTLTRRLKKALVDFPVLADEFLAVAKMFEPPTGKKTMNRQTTDHH